MGGMGYKDGSDCACNRKPIAVAPFFWCYVPPFTPYFYPQEDQSVTVLNGVRKVPRLGSRENRYALPRTALAITLLPVTH